jgi:hypothetical protein
MGWSHRLAEQRRQQREFSQTPVLGYCPPGESRSRLYWSASLHEYRTQFDYRHPDGTLFSCIARTLPDAQARRNAWLVERAEAAQRERAKAEASQ